MNAHGTILATRKQALPLMLLFCCLVGCAPESSQDQPFVQHSAEQSARWTVDLNRVLDGVYRTYRPRCLDKVGLGHTVEFRNFAPQIPANVSSLASPEGATPLFSPNLVRPYNYVGRSDSDNDICETRGDDGCEQKAHYSYWRHTFEIPGVYDYIDTNAGEPGRKVVDPYYGTVTFVGIDPNTPFGTICVEDEAGEGCLGVCCADDSDCESGQVCMRSAVDAEGRCLTPSG
ncbi:MAG: hypothetical protein OEZ06_08440 [Myxococcales bacterium]|nr:hypothetical protein [Myxococcales bacterium]